MKETVCNHTNIKQICKKIKMKFNKKGNHINQQKHSSAKASLRYCENFITQGKEVCSHINKLGENADLTL